LNVGGKALYAFMPARCSLERLRQNFSAGARNRASMPLCLYAFAFALVALLLLCLYASMPFAFMPLCLYAFALMPLIQILTYPKKGVFPVKCFRPRDTTAVQHQGVFGLVADP
jgi:hypothetical protein